MKKYKSYLYIQPKGEIYIGEFDTHEEAMRITTIVSDFLRLYTATKTSPSIIEIKPKWNLKSGEVMKWKCSECGYIIFGTPTNYCPDCGVKMIDE